MVIMKHHHVLSSLANRIGWVVLDKSKVMRELQASSARAHEDDAWVLSPGEERHKVLNTCRGAGGISGDGQGNDFADGAACVGSIARDSCLFWELGLARRFQMRRFRWATHIRMQDI